MVELAIPEPPFFKFKAPPGSEELLKKRRDSCDSTKKPEERYDSGSSIKKNRKINESRARVRNWLIDLELNEKRYNQRLSRITEHQLKTEKTSQATATGVKSSNDPSKNDGKLKKKWKSLRKPSENVKSSPQHSLSRLSMKISKSQRMEIKDKIKDKRNIYRPKIPINSKTILPVRSDQKKLSSKLFLSSLLPTDEKQLYNLRKRELQQKTKKL